MSNLYYIYLGERLPSYTADAISLAHRFSGNNLYFIGNKNAKKFLKGLPIEFVELEGFYDRQPIGKIENRFVFSKNFRNGFWLKTLERFFVMEQYMKKFSVEEVFHAELDQLLFNTDLLVKNLRDLDKSGVFLPFHNPTMAVASIFYCNKIESLQSFIDFSSKQERIVNEMELLASWAKQRKADVHFLPSLATEYKSLDFYNELDLEYISAVQISGVVDPLQIGPWIGGNDPRNEVLAVKPKTKFVEPYSPYLLSKSDFQTMNYTFDPLMNRLTVNSNNFQANIYNLHFHSKLHPWLNRISEPERRLIYLANSTESIELRYARLQQIKYRTTYFFKEFRSAVKNDPSTLVKAIKELSKYIKYFSKILVVSFNLRLKRRPSSDPFLSGDTFRKICDFVYETGNEEINVNQIKDRNIIFCQSDLFPQFNADVLSKLNSYVLLIFGNSDQNFNSKNTQDLNLNYVKSVFSQNLEEKIDKFTVLPIGLENAWRFDHGKVLNFRFLRLFRPRKIYKIMWSFNTQNNTDERERAQLALMECSQAVNLGWVSKFKHRKSLSSYAFVASPPGNGLDCHRTWEAMYLRCVPIVRRSFMTEEYERLGLPIWIVDSYEELVGLTEDFLRSKYKELEPCFDSEALWFDFWENKIKNSY